MIQNYIIVNGKKYYSGAIFIIREHGRNKEAVYIGYDSKYNTYHFRIDGKRCTMRLKSFQEYLVDTTIRVDTNVCQPETKRINEFKIDGLLLGWIWYIFLMAISTIFKERAGLWILISATFFDWRFRKIKEEGTYIEW